MSRRVSRTLCGDLCALATSLLALHLGFSHAMSATERTAGRSGLLSVPPKSAATFKVFEIALGAASPGANPYVEGPSVTAKFECINGPATGRSYIVKGFWDGGNVWRVRFAPTAAGKWRYETTSDDVELNGIGGTFEALEVSATEKARNPLLHGFLERDGFAWKLSDGTPFLPIGDTQWSFAEEFFPDEWRSWMAVLSEHGFNTFLGCIWLGIYDRGHLAPFPNADPASDMLNVDYFRRLDGMVRHANGLGIMMGLTIGGFPDNSKWFKRFKERERHDRWFRYCVARYSAFNVRWCLFGEVDEADTPWGETWQQAVKRYAQLVKDEDPYDHPIGSHHRTVDTSSADDPNIAYIEVQIARSDKQYEKALSYRQWGKPLWFEEYWYEGMEFQERHNDSVALGIRNTHRNFVAAMAFPTMGSMMRPHASYPDFAPARATAAGVNLSQYLRENDPGIRRMSYFASFYQGLDLLHFEPAGKLVDRGQCGRFGTTLVVFLDGGGQVSINLSGLMGTFGVRALDINSGQVTALGKVEGGSKRILDTQTTSDTVLRLDPLEARP